MHVSTMESLPANGVEAQKPGKLGLDKTLKVYRIFAVWDKAVGSRIARHSQPRRFQKETLWITVDSSTWLQQLSFLSEEIREKVNDALGVPLVKAIRFQIGDIRSQKYKPPAPPFRDARTVDEETRKAIANATASVHDQELRETMHRLFEKSTRFRTDQGNE